MSSAVKQNWNAVPPAVTSLTATGLGTLTTNNSWTSTVIDNHTFLGLDCLVYTTITTAASGTSATGWIDIFVQPSLDNTNFSDAGNDIYVGTINAIANSTAYKHHFSAAKSLQGVLPPYFYLRYNNQTGGTLTAATINYNLLAYNVG